MGIKDFFRVTDEDGNTIKDMGEKLKGHDFKCLAGMKGLRIVIDTPTILHAAVRGMVNVNTMTHDGRITSFLNVVFFNALQFKRMGIDQLWVFDGNPPTIKKGELDKRKKARDKAEAQKKAAQKKGDKKEFERLEKIAYKLESYVYTDTQLLLNRMGIPWATAPEEGEAYCAYLNKKGDYDFILSLDADCFMFGATQVLRPTKEDGKKSYYMYRREDIMKQLDIDEDQLLDIGICLGTDFSIKKNGIGPKTVVKKVKAGGLIFNDAQKNARAYFKTAPHEGAVHVSKPFNRNKLIKFLNKRGFSIERLADNITELEKLSE
jgi:flap endonuclease-1